MCVGVLILSKTRAPPHRCFVLTLGFHPDVALRRLFEANPPPNREDKVIIVTGPMIEGVRKSYQFLISQLMSYKVKNHKLVSLNPNEPHNAMWKLAKNLYDCRESRVIVELGAGLRSLGTLIASTLINLGFTATFHVLHETGEGETTIPEGVVEFLREINRRRGEARLLATLLENEGATANELARILGTKEKTIHNRLSQLRRLGLVHKRGRGTARLTHWGKTIAEIIRKYDLA